VIGIKWRILKRFICFERSRGHLIRQQQDQYYFWIMENCKQLFSLQLSSVLFSLGLFLLIGVHCKKRYINVWIQYNTVEFIYFYFSVWSHSQAFHLLYLLWCVNTVKRRLASITKGPRLKHCKKRRARLALRYCRLLSVNRLNSQSRKVPCKYMYKHRRRLGAARASYPNNWETLILSSVIKLLKLFVYPNILVCSSNFFWHV